MKKVNHLSEQIDIEIVDRERGFILVTALVLISILTIVGVMSFFKTTVEIKVSKSSGDTAQALEAANAGLDYLYNYWATDSAGQTEFGDVLKYVSNNTASKPAIYMSLAPASMNDLDIIASGDIDAYIAGSSFTGRVYNVTSTGLTSGTWGSGGSPQVAVWATSFQKDVYGYPYETPNTASCTDCKVAVYALGRSGDAKRMARQMVSDATSTIQGVSAMTNAPAYATWQDACDGAHNASPVGGVDKNGNTPVPATTTDTDWLIEVTQAEYTPGKIPSGVAFVSNTNMGPGGKSFRKGVDTTTVATMDSDPLLMYSGHTSTTAMKADLMSTTQDNTAPPNAPDLPAGKLPRKLLDQRTFGVDALDFFDPADPNKQLFNLDAYRWAAEQFTCQNSGTLTAAAAAHTADGKFCSKAEALRLALVAQGYSAKAPVTGRLTLAEFEYNIAHSIPMFGIVRVMYPVYYQSSMGTCANLGGAQVLNYDTASPTQGIYGGGAYDGTPTTLDGDGSLGNDAKLIVYGSVLYDFFTDMDGDGFFDPAASGSHGSPALTVYEHLADAFEAVDARMELEVPDFINPALPNVPSTSLLAFPTAAGGTIHVNTNAKPVNLASPTQGWFPASEGMIPVNSTVDYGQMALMGLSGGVSKLNKLAVDIKTAGGLTGTAATDAQTYFSSVSTRLNYYYDLMKATAKRSDSNSWPIAAFPANMSANFCIGAEDCAAGNNDGDKVHLLFPSAYMHGWKVALAALDLSASDWNTLLDGIDTLAGKHTGTYGLNYGSAAMPKGSPFNKAVDPGFSRALTSDPYALIPSQNNYFYVESGSGGYGLLTDKWADIPAQMYAGGLVDIHEVSNVSGVTYTPGPLEWETGHSALNPATSYFNGAIITGFGAYNENSGSSYTVLVYDNQSVDNLSGNVTTVVLRRYAWQGLR